MSNVYIKTVDGGEDTTPSGTDAIEIDNGTTSMWVLLSNLYKALGTGTATAAKALMGDGAWTTVTTPTSTETTTNKRIQKRRVTVTQSATPTINTDNGDIFTMTGLAQAITSLTTNLSGTPVTDEMIVIHFTDDGTGRAITPGASFVGTVEFPLAGLTTTANKRLTTLWMWNGSAWALSGKLNGA
jgi:hypothetical protein